ncbi:hypothetical protein ACIBG8_04340 [Nonomuraea sp. NPDC050556]|uniref:hypothetical protein n=1 Tax=Nonomuraea sp. NPDC050556 TaxID=3364369 RepID=UPI0037B2AA16
MVKQALPYVNWMSYLQALKYAEKDGFEGVTRIPRPSGPGMYVDPKLFQDFLGAGLRHPDAGKAYNDEIAGLREQSPVTAFAKDNSYNWEKIKATDRWNDHVMRDAGLYGLYSGAYESADLDELGDTARRNFWLGVVGGSVAGRFPIPVDGQALAGSVLGLFFADTYEEHFGDDPGKAQAELREAYRQDLRAELLAGGMTKEDVDEAVHDAMIAFDAVKGDAEDAQAD